jgi:replicative DNA helicase
MQDSSVLPFPNRASNAESFTPSKIAPHSSEAEQAVLGGLMLKSDAWLEVADVISTEDFYHNNHKTIFEAVKTLLEEGYACNIITVKDALERQGIVELDNKHIIEYLDELIQNTPSIINVKAYADIVRKKSILRRLINVADKIAGYAYDPTNSNENEILDKAEQMIFEIAEHGQKNQKGFIEIKDVLAQALDRIDTMFQQDEAITGVPTGFTDFDELTSGLQPSDMVIVAGRPSMGKTSFAMNVAEYVAIKVQNPVAVFSMEMPAEQLGMRLIASLARVNQQKVRTGKLEDDDWPKITTAISILSEAPLFIDDTPALNPIEMRARARRLAREHGQLGLIVIDYLQLMQGSGKGDNRANEVSEISRSLKALAKELNVPVMALSQLNRGVEQRSDKRPMMSDLRESGCLTGESLIYLPEQNTYVPIKDLLGKKDFKVLAINTKTWKLEQSIVSKAFSTGVKPVYRLTTQLGRTIRATGNHKFLTIDGWKRLDELQLGKTIALPRKIDSMDAKETLTKNNLSRHRATQVAEIVHSEEIHKLAESDIYWDKVVSVEYDGEEEVFDLTVPNLHNFVANDIIVHNSIEQDADVIVFIYRDEVYNEDSEAKGTAEIIVGKQRNGPIGTVRLAFVGSLTKFENYTEEYHYNNDDVDFYNGDF